MIVAVKNFHEFEGLAGFMVWNENEWDFLKSFEYHVDRLEMESWKQRDVAVYCQTLIKLSMMWDKYWKLDDAVATGASTADVLGLSGHLFIADGGLNGNAWSGELMIVEKMRNKVFGEKMREKVNKIEEINWEYLCKAYWKGRY